MEEILEYICHNCETDWGKEHLHEGEVPCCGLCDIPLQGIVSDDFFEPVAIILGKALA